MKKNDNTHTWIVVNLMTCTGRSLLNQLRFVFGKEIGTAFAKEGGQHKSNVRVGFNVSENNNNE
jgi:hypothetical protein